METFFLYFMCHAVPINHPTISMVYYLQICLAPSWRSNGELAVQQKSITKLLTER